MAQHAAEQARPEAQRLARQARAAAEAARPHLERAGREAGRYVREHDEELRRAAITGAEVAARHVMPPGVARIIDAAQAARPRAEAVPRPEPHAEDDEPSGAPESGERQDPSAS
jgi:hypothetical protein